MVKKTEKRFGVRIFFNEEFTFLMCPPTKIEYSNENWKHIRKIRDRKLAVQPNSRNLLHVNPWCENRVFQNFLYWWRILKKRNCVTIAQPESKNCVYPPRDRHCCSSMQRSDGSFRILYIERTVPRTRNFHRWRGNRYDGPIYEYPAQPGMPSWIEILV